MSDMEPLARPQMGQEKTSMENIGLLRIKALAKYVEFSDDIEDDTKEIVVQQRVRFYLFWLFGGTIFPDNSGAWLSLDSLLDMEDLDAMGRKAWGAFVWERYTEAINNGLPEGCRHGQDIWRTHVPLICGIYRE
ncbi:hypothetical protein RND71_019350 [Anisodus tanguticus]|uniref:Aminotransferase-like plant mobile domain-containing protein n=1 Tax=Anisodus tanguticus TaxID=243964 RepID=A0AAE1V8E5_9SOLA|nr:hypothetical protein RND71_019350 [Anisodus tanguticus]